MQGSRTDAPQPCDRGIFPYAPAVAAPTNRPFVIAQLGQSLDGRIATPSGESRWINRISALEHVHRLRATVDAVLVGVGTVIADDPMLTVRRVAGRNPARVVIDPTGRCPTHAKVFKDDGVRRILIHAAQANVCGPMRAEQIALEAHGRTLLPGDIVNALFSIGLRSMLVEGGAWTISQFIDADAVDRLHILTSPLILGGGKPGLQLRPVASLAQARRPTASVHVLPDGDVLFDCDMRNLCQGEPP